jgi:hypothetical protein
MSKNTNAEMELSGNNLGENLIRRGKHGEYKWTATELAGIVHLDNHHKEDSGSGVVISSRMIMEHFEGPNALCASVFTNPKTGIDNSAQDKKDRI